MKIEFKSFGADINDLVRSHDFDAGLDFRAQESFDIAPGDTYNGGLGFGLVLPPNYLGTVFIRSHLVSRGLTSVQNAPVDPDYTGEWHYALKNENVLPLLECLADPTKSEEDYLKLKDELTIHVEKGDRVGQIVVTQFEQVEPALLEDMNRRGSNGLGSTGDR